MVEERPEQVSYSVAASLLSSERTEDYTLALERCWLSIFGAPQCLVTDEGRGWLSEQFAEWSDTHAIHHVVAPGEAREKLALVERRHALLRKAVEIYLADLELEAAVAIRQALVYIIPQMNASPTSSGFSPTQWVLGQQPHFPGDLLDPQLSPAQLQGAPLFETELQRRSLAKMAIVQADTDQKLRRALLRRYAGTNMLLRPGQKCYYWRDARAPDLIKIRWKGPAVVVAREDDPSDGRPRVYWISHKTQLLRCAPHHVRPELQRSATTSLEEMVVAKEALAALKSRGVTRYSDLLTQNKRRLEDVDLQMRNLVNPHLFAVDWLTLRMLILMTWTCTPLQSCLQSLRDSSRMVRLNLTWNHHRCLVLRVNQMLSCQMLNALMQSCLQSLKMSFLLLHRCWNRLENQVLEKRLQLRLRCLWTLLRPHSMRRLTLKIFRSRD